MLAKHWCLGLLPFVFVAACARTSTVADPARGWARVAGPAPGAAESIGTAGAGCLRGGVALAAAEGLVLQYPERGRNYAHPVLISLIGELAAKARLFGELRVGDLSQPRGGPMPSGHASHQNGLDADLAYETRPGRPAGSVLVAGRPEVDSRRWPPGGEQLLIEAARDARVDRIFVHPAVKKRLCAARVDDGVLRKIRPWWGHDAHFHVRLRCPSSDAACSDTEPIAVGSGCDATLDWWFGPEASALTKTKLHDPVPIPELPPTCEALRVFPLGEIAP